MYNQQKSNLIEETITLVNVDETDTQFKITDEKNNFYSFFKTKRAGGPTQAAVDLQAFGLGQQVNIVYEMNGNFRNVARIKPAGGQVSTNTPPVNVRSPFQSVPPVVPQGLPNTGFGLTATPAPLPRDLSITAQAFAKSLLESHQATPADLVNPQWWSTIIFPAINAMIEGGQTTNNVEDISVEDIPF